MVFTHLLVNQNIKSKGQRQIPVQEIDLRSTDANWFGLYLNLGKILDGLLLRKTVCHILGPPLTLIFFLTPKPWLASET